MSQSVTLARARGWAGKRSVQRTLGVLEALHREGFPYLVRFGVANLVFLRKVYSVRTYVRTLPKLARRDI